MGYCLQNLGLGEDSTIGAAPKRMKPLVKARIPFNWWASLGFIFAFASNVHTQGHGLLRDVVHNNEIYTVGSADSWAWEADSSGKLTIDTGWRSPEPKVFVARCMAESNNEPGLPVVRYENQQAYNYLSA
jgi:hypothetical protein